MAPRERAPASRCWCSGYHLRRWAAGTKHSVEVLDEDLSEDVDGGQSAKGHGAVTRPHQVDPKHAGQVRRTHPVHNALLGHLMRNPTSLHTYYCRPTAYFMSMSDWYFLSRYDTLISTPLYNSTR